jgi:hypothetical protein
MMKSLDSSNSRYPKLSSFFRDFGVSHFAIPGLLMMRSLDSSNSRYPKLRNGVISRSAKLFVYVPISGFRRFAFHRFAFRHSCGEVFRHFNSRYLGLRNGVISRSVKLLLMCLFRDFGIPDFATPGLLC